MTTMNGIHDSETCDADNGHPCSQCVWANEQEQAQLSQSTYESLRDSVLERVHEAMAEDCDCPKHQTATKDAEIDPATLQRISTAIRQDQTFASLTTVRAALADVMDVGPPPIDNRKCYWLFDHEDEGEGESETRMQFIDAVERRILQLQQSPHEMDAGLRVVREDVTEMGRLVKERTER